MPSPVRYGPEQDGYRRTEELCQFMTGVHVLFATEGLRKYRQNVEVPTWGLSPHMGGNLSSSQAPSAWSVPRSIGWSRRPRSWH